MLLLGLREGGWTHDGEDARRWRRNNKQAESGPPESATPVSRGVERVLSWR